MVAFVIFFEVTIDLKRGHDAPVLSAAVHILDSDVIGFEFTFYFGHAM